MTNRLTLPVVLLAVFVLPISISGTAIALPSIAGDLGSSPTALQWVVNGFNASFALFTLLWGVLSDRFGYRETFAAGVGIIIASSVVSAIAPNLLILDLGRILAGAGGAAVFTGSSAMLSHAFSGAARGRAFALLGTTIGLGLALGPTISGALVSLAGWRGVFVAFAVVLILPFLGVGKLPRIRPERSADAKLVDFRLLRNPHFLAFALVPVAAAIGFVTMLSYLPVALSAVFGFSAGAAGVFLLPMTIPVLIGPALAARAIKHPRISPMTIMYASLAALVVGDLGLLVMSPSHAPALLFPAMVLLGFGFGLPIGLVDGEALAAAPPSQSGTAAGLVNFLRLGSEAVVVGAYAAGLGRLLTSSIGNPAVAAEAAAGHAGHAAEYASALHLVVVIMAILGAVAAGVIAALHRARTRAIAASAAGSPVRAG
jgi:predicted MFS family arabinose efflux permease